MWLLLTFLLPSISTLRSLSWAALALSFLLLLVGLFVWNSNIWTLSTLVSKLNFEHTKNTVQIFKDGQLLPSVPPELLTQTVMQLADAYRVDRKRVAILLALFFGIASVSLWQELVTNRRIVNSIRELHNVEVLNQDAPRVYTVMVPSEGNWPLLHDDQQTIRLCDEGDDLPLKAGMVMTRFQYKQRSGCQLIDGQTEVDYLRNTNKRVIDREGNLVFAKEN